MKYKHFIFFNVLVIVLMGLAISCSNPLQKKAPSESKQGDKEQPQDLERLLTTVDDIFQNLIEIDTMQRTKDEQPKDQEQGKKTEEEVAQQEQTKQDKGTEGGKAGPETQGEQQQPKDEGKEGEEGKKQEDIKKAWADAKETVEKLNTGWNSFEPKAEEENISKDATSAFEEELNTLSTSVKDKKLIESLTAANGLQKYLSDFTSHYKEIVPPKLYDIKYYYQESYVKSIEKSWIESKEQAEKALEEWKKITSDMEKEDEELAKKMQFSIEDMALAADTEDITVMELKYNVVKENYKAFEKLFQDKAEEEKKEKKQE